MTNTQSTLTEIQQHIARHLRSRQPLELSQSHLNHVVGMVETGEATLEDVRAVGGDDLARVVKSCL